MHDFRVSMRFNKLREIIGFKGCKALGVAKGKLSNVVPSKERWTHHAMPP